MRLLVTRPQPDAQRTAAALRAHGHEAVIAPLMQIEAIDDVDPGSGPWAAILMTSANAANAIAHHRRMAELRAVPVFAVGRRSAEAARASGFTNVVSADGDVRDLARLVTACVPPRTALLYLAGEERSGDLVGDLPDFTVQTVAIYRTVGADASPLAAALAQDLEGVLHFSRRSSELYIRAARAAGRLGEALALVHFCLSAQVAQPLAAAGATRIRIAARPEETALLELVGPA